jgi:C4-dicarboxylate-specific signal transduction histidine kinase
VLSNLIGKAVNALGSQGHLELIIRKRRKHVEIVVANNGAGIVVENPEIVFQPFFSTKGARGTGLGISLSTKSGSDPVAQSARRALDRDSVYPFPCSFDFCWL